MSIIRRCSRSRPLAYLPVLSTNSTFSINPNRLNLSEVTVDCELTFNILKYQINGFDEKGDISQI